MSQGNRPLPLKDRLNAYQMGRRDIRKQGRATVAAILQGQANMLVNSFNGFVGMNPIDRLVWLLFGARFVHRAKGYVLLGLIVALVLPIVLFDARLVVEAVRHLVGR